MTNDSDTDSHHDHDDMMKITNDYYHDGFLFQLYPAWCVKKTLFPSFSITKNFIVVVVLQLSGFYCPFICYLCCHDFVFYCYLLLFLTMDLVRCIFTLVPIIISFLIISFLVSLDHE